MRRRGEERQRGEGKHQRAEETRVTDSFRGGASVTTVQHSFFFSSLSPSVKGVISLSLSLSLPLSFSLSICLYFPTLLTVLPQWLSEKSAAWLQTPLVAEVQQEVTKWIHFTLGHRKGTKRKRGEPCLKVNFKEMGPEQIVLLLELLLEEEKMSAGVLQTLERTYSLRMQDAEVKHRWCELVVKHKHSAAYKDVEDFLIDNQAMGVYLYGELMVHEDSRQQALARRCFSLTQEHMDPAALSVVSEMIL